MISIITPCYNVQGYIADTIKSVLSQTYQDWEMLIIDDCSTDRSAEIIKKYTRIDKRIKYFKTLKSSGSPSLTRNIGLDNVKGDLVAFLDADDIWLPDKLEKQYKFIKERNYQLIYSYYEKMDYEGNRRNRIVKTGKETHYQKLLQSNTIPCLTAVVSTSAIGDTRFKQIPQEDFCFWLDILKKGYVAHNLCDVTALYREARSSRSANKFAMFKGYWNVIYNHQNINWLKCCYYMITYTVLGLAKYMK